MRNALRTVLTLAALAGMLGGMLSRAEISSDATAGPTAMELEQLRLVGESVREEAAPPRYAQARREHARIAVNPDPENPIGDLIEISIAEQRLRAWREGKIVYQFKVSTAKIGFRTPKGRFKILDKARRWRSRQYNVWMPEALRFKGSYFIHGLTYDANPNVRGGANTLGRPASHGCVRVGTADAKLLWNWAYKGLPVWVH